MRSAAGTGRDFFVPLGARAAVTAATTHAGAALSTATTRTGAALSAATEFAIAPSDMVRGSVVFEVVLRSCAGYFLFHVNKVHRCAYLYAHRRNDGIMGIARKILIRRDNL
jgi:hypothetical protein